MSDADDDSDLDESTHAAQLVVFERWYRKTVSTSTGVLQVTRHQALVGWARVGVDGLPDPSPSLRQRILSGTL